MKLNFFLMCGIFLSFNAFSETTALTCEYARLDNHTGTSHTPEDNFFETFERYFLIDNSKNLVQFHEDNSSTQKRDFKEIKYTEIGTSIYFQEKRSANILFEWEINKISGIMRQKLFDNKKWLSTWSYICKSSKPLF